MKYLSDLFRLVAFGQKTDFFYPSFACSFMQNFTKSVQSGLKCAKNATMSGSNTPITTSLFVFSLSFFAANSSVAQVITIEQARALGNGAHVTVRGVVTNGDEMGKIRYFQDGTGGLAAFPGAGSAPGFETTVIQGDSIEVTGTLVTFQNLLEISPITAYSVISQNNPAPSPKKVALSELNESLESQLIEIECTLFANGGSTFSGGTTHDISDPDGGFSKVYFRTVHPLSGTTIPTGPVQLVSILSQYGDYQLLPRNLEDLKPGTCFFYADKPEQSDIQTTSFTVNWVSNLVSNGFLEFGTTSELGQIAASPLLGSTHNITLSNLLPGSIYWVRSISVHNSDTVRSEIIPFATQSLSSGEIEIYFNHAIDPQYLGAKQPKGVTPQACLAAIINRINNAQQTIDVAVYNNNSIEIVNALKAAHNRGVQVRYIAALNADSPALEPSTPFPVVYGNNIALMHNKFMVMDADNVSESWVMSGSLNWTDNNIFDDYNNLIFIQDQSLARTYKLEFEEMWGSSDALPGPLNQFFGNLKKDNTPHRFIIGGVAIESYFSPSDNVSDKIVNIIESSNESAEFALLTFTKNEIGDALSDRFNNHNVSVRGMIENVNDSGSEFNFLRSQGIDVRQHVQDYQLHHKYVVIDGLSSTSQPLVLTGSHNWSQTAEDQNDENTLIFYDENIARLYLAEFEKRMAENPVSTREINKSPFKISPNPVCNAFSIQSDIFDLDPETKIQIWDQTGKLLLETAYENGKSISIAQLADGAYILKIKGKNAYAALPLQKISR